MANLAFRAVTAMQAGNEKYPCVGGKKLVMCFGSRKKRCDSGNRIEPDERQDRSHNFSSQY